MAGAAEGSIVTVTMAHVLVTLALLAQGRAWSGFMTRHRALLRSPRRRYRVLARAGLVSNIFVTTAIAIIAVVVYTTTTVHLVRH
jgi:hypothetical protein